MEVEETSKASTPEQAGCKPAVGFSMARCAHEQDRRLEEAWAEVEANIQRLDGMTFLNPKP